MGGLINPPAFSKRQNHLIALVLMHIIVDLDIDAIHVLKLFCRRDFCVKCGIMLFYSSFPDSFGLIHTVFANRLLQKEKEKPKKKKRKKKQPKNTKKIENCENN